MNNLYGKKLWLAIFALICRHVAQEFKRYPIEEHPTNPVWLFYQNAPRLALGVAMGELSYDEAWLELSRICRIKGQEPPKTAHNVHPSLDWRRR